MKFKVKLSDQDGLLHFESEQDETSDQQRDHSFSSRSNPDTDSPPRHSGPAVFYYHGGPSVNIGNTTHVHQSPSNRVDSAQSSDSDNTDNKKNKKKPQAIDYAAVAFIFAFLAACSAVIGKYVKNIYDDYSFRLHFKGDRFRIISNILISGILGGLMGIATGLVVASFVPNVFIVAVGSVLGGILGSVYISNATKSTLKQNG
jgi:hypothetical protein